jgi:large subunit ribosomal protein L35
VLAEHRNEIIKKIEMMRGRIARLSAKPAETQSEITSKENSLRLMRKKLEEWKIEADINDPLVKKRFEDGMGMIFRQFRDVIYANCRIGDMNKPIYRHLADKKWREYKRALVLQRVTQMNVVPDVIASINPVASVDISFPDAKVQPGDYVESIHSQSPPILNVQVFDSGPRLVTVLVVDSDVPDFENDAFVHRCHGAFANIEISPTNGKINLADFMDKADSTVQPWTPPYALKGSPYHRLSVFVLEQPKNKPLDIKDIKQWVPRDNIVTRKLVAKADLKVVGVTMFRTQWDEGTAEVMEEHSIPGTDIQMKRKAPEKAPYKKRDTRRMRG